MDNKLAKYLNESPQTDLKLIASQMEAAVKKFNFNLNRYKEEIENFKNISNLMLELEDMVEKIRKLL